jgi:uncharacterized protein YecE (DUF72 family)
MPAPSIAPHVQPTDPTRAGGSTSGSVVAWHVGTMGFSYADWSGPFYPPGLKAGDWLAYYAKHFNAVELDTTFHAAPPPERFDRWAAATPDDFRFCPKLPRAITHDNPLSGGGPATADFIRSARRLGPKLGVVLIQFAPTFEANQFDAVDRFLGTLPTDVRFAVEVRHRSWGTPETLHMLHERGCAFVAAEYAQRAARVFATADFLYLRLIGVHGQFPKHEAEQVDPADRLAWWHGAVSAALPKVKEIWGFANNDYAGYSPATANRLKRLFGLATKEPTEGKTPSLFD